MMIRIVLLFGAIFISLAPCHHATASVTNFTITGTYGETLTYDPTPADPDGVVTLFSAGDPFTIQGSFDTALQPEMATKVNPHVVLPDVALFGWYQDYSAIASLTCSIPLGLINAYYPSEESAMNDDDYRNGAYSLTTNFPADASNFFLADSYTALSASNPGAAGAIQYNYHMVTTDLGGGQTLVERTSDEITLNITEFTQSAAVPAPAALLLLGSGVAGLTAWRRKRGR